MTHREHVSYDVFCSSYWKKDIDFWLLTLEARDFIHSWTCQTECIQAITDERVNRPVVRLSKVTPWQLYRVWLLTLPPTVICILLLYPTNWISIPLLSPQYGYLWDCVIGNSLLVLTCWFKYLLLGNFLIPLWLKLHVGSNTNPLWLCNIQNACFAVTSHLSLCQCLS